MERTSQIKVLCVGLFGLCATVRTRTVCGTVQVSGDKCPRDVSGHLRLSNVRRRGSGLVSIRLNVTQSVKKMKAGGTGEENDSSTFIENKTTEKKQTAVN